MIAAGPASTPSTHFLLARVRWGQASAPGLRWRSEQGRGGGRRDGLQAQRLLPERPCDGPNPAGQCLRSRSSLRRQHRLGGFPAPVEPMGPSPPGRRLRTFVPRPTPYPASGALPPPRLRGSPAWASGPACWGGGCAGAGREGKRTHGPMGGW